jgi:RNA polymerase sigma-70 factor (ECF subfamily)
MQPLGDRLRAGDPKAAAEIYTRHAAQLARLAEQHLNRKLAGRVDGEDVVQSVFRTLFARCARGELRLDNSAEIWRLLVCLTLRKARARARQHFANKRDARAEVAGADSWLDVVAGHEPDPAEAVEMVDQIENLLRGLPPLYCHILQQRLQGQTVAAIALDLGVSRQTIYRALELLQYRLRRNAGKDLS